MPTLTFAPFDLDDVQRSFDERTLKRGRYYYLNHRVGDVHATEYGITCEVLGSMGRPFAVILRIGERNGERRLSGACTCPVGENCKHAAALALAAVSDDVTIERPAAALQVRIDERDPQPVLRLTSNTQGAAVAELLFAYDDVLLAPDDARPEFRSVEGYRTVVRPRAIAFERIVRERVNAFGFAPSGSALRLPDERAWLDFLDRSVAPLRFEGWRVDVDASFPYAIADAQGELHAEIFDGQMPQWFDLELGIDVAGERVSLLPVLLDALARIGADFNTDPQLLVQRATTLYGRLPSGAFVALEAERVARIVATLAGFLGDEPARGRGRISIPMVHAGSLAELDGVAMQWVNAPAVRALLDDLATYANKRIEVPAAFKTELRPYQHEGVAWLQTLRAHGFGGVLADDMGLGKTVQLLAHVAIEFEAKRLDAPVLVVAPTSVIPNWRAEIARFVPDLPAGTIELTSYALLHRRAGDYAKRAWSIVVLDEAQAIKNPRSKVAHAALRLPAQQRIAMTGTPVENHLEELWSIFAFAVPGLLSDRARFARAFRTPIERRGDVRRRHALAARIRPFFLRRTKERVAEELPEKTEIVQHVELTGAQRDLYETIRVVMHRRVHDEVARRGLARSRIVVLDALLKLRQVCCDPRLLDLPAAAAVEGSQKLDALLEMLESLLEDGRRVLLFSQFTSMLDLIKPELHARNLPFVELRGDTRDRVTPVARFQKGDVPLFLISLKAGGTGLNLTAADTVIHYDPWWNPAVERQATDRAHRIGQTQHVFIYKLIAQNTVEERILELQERKGALAAGLFEESASERLDLSLDDLDQLFS